MDQQLSAMVKYSQMFRLSATVPDLCLHPKLINDRLLDA